MVELRELDLFPVTLQERLTVNCFETEVLYDPHSTLVFLLQGSQIAGFSYPVSCRGCERSGFSYPILPCVNCRWFWKDHLVWLQEVESAGIEKGI